MLPAVFIAPPPFAEMLLWNSAGLEEAATLPSSYGGKLLLCLPRGAGTCRGRTTGIHEKEFLPQPLSVCHPHTCPLLFPQGDIVQTPKVLEWMQKHMEEREHQAESC